MVTSAMISFVSGKQYIRLFTVLWLNTWYEQANVIFFGLVGGALRADVVIARYRLIRGSILWLPSPAL